MNNNFKQEFKLIIYESSTIGGGFISGYIMVKYTMLALIPLLSIMVLNYLYKTK